MTDHNYVAYEDHPTGLMIEEFNGAGQFDNVTLHPTVAITAESDAQLAEELHHRVADYCFIARSVQTPIGHVGGTRGPRAWPDHVRAPR
ncbi:hypothetical protein [Agromyces salentinus]|uniref:OsmC family peroxiredoxin n=1 Tax=Agromyces salentinus TaxID=269421 RepID=A0ABN2MGV5_9MICO